MLPRKRGDPAGLTLPCSRVVLLTARGPCKVRAERCPPPPPLGASRKAWTCPHAERRLRRGGVQSAAGARPRDYSPQRPRAPGVPQAGPGGCRGLQFLLCSGTSFCFSSAIQAVTGCCSFPPISAKGPPPGNGALRWKPVRRSRPER